MYINEINYFVIMIEFISIIFISLFKTIKICFLGV